MKIYNYFGRTTMFKKMLLLMAAVLFSLNDSVFAQAAASSMTIVDLPATGTDAAIGIDTSKTYTHTFDFGEGDEATINGVQFEAPFFGNLRGDPWSAVSIHGYGYVIADSRGLSNINSHEGSDVDTLCDGNSADMLRDMIYFSRAQEVGHGILITLKDLTPGTQYSVRYYYRPWDPDIPRPITVKGDGPTDSTFVDSIRIDIDAQPGAHYLDYTFAADDDDKIILFAFHDASGQGQGAHIYGFTCEVVEESDVDSKSSAKPSTYELMQNYPNPFNPKTDIQFQIPNDGHVTISVYNSLGQPVAKLIDRDMQSGVHHVTFDAAEFSSGIYFYKIQAADFMQVKKMMLLK